MHKKCNVCALLLTYIQIVHSVYILCILCTLCALCAHWNFRKHNSHRGVRPIWILMDISEYLWIFKDIDGYHLDIFWQFGYRFGLIQRKISIKDIHSISTHIHMISTTISIRDILENLSIQYPKISMSIHFQYPLLISILYSHDLSRLYPLKSIVIQIEYPFNILLIS